MADLLRDNDGDLVIRDGDVALANPLESDTRQVQYLIKTHLGDDLNDPRLGTNKENTAGRHLSRPTLDQSEDDIRSALLYRNAFLASEIKVLAAALNRTEYGVFVQINRTYKQKTNSPWLAAFLYDTTHGTETQLNGVQTNDL